MYRADEHVSEDDIFNIYYLENARKDKIPPYKFDAFINSCSVTFEIETGASITIINEESIIIYLFIIYDYLLFLFLIYLSLTTLGS